MYKSTEIRWFTQEENKTISRWFTKQGMSFNTTQARRDYYLTALDHDDIAPKIREGKIEIKHRIGTPKIHQFSSKTKGYLEEYIKWSFALDINDGLSEEIVKGNKHTSEWLEVYKERMGVKLAKGNKGTLEIYDIHEAINNGCQIEYTQIRVKGKTWYSFNLEWFGNEFLIIDSNFVAEILGDSLLKPEDSMGYGMFLKKVNN
jgi:hypothetical protein